MPTAILFPWKLTSLFCNIPVVICKLDLVFCFYSNCKQPVKKQNKTMFFVALPNFDFLFLSLGNIQRKILHKSSHLKASFKQNVLNTSRYDFFRFALKQVECLGIHPIQWVEAEWKGDFRFGGKGTAASLAVSKAFCFGYFPGYISYISHLRIVKQFTYIWIYEEDVEEINKSVQIIEQIFKIRNE